MSRKKPPRLGLALGGGGARGWAHIGVIRALEQAGLRPEVVAGTSMGAAVGAAYAAGKLDRFEAWARGLDRRTVLGLFDFSFRGGLIEASRVFDQLTDVLPDVDIEALPMRFGAVATDLQGGTEVWLRSGPLRTALRASIAIPGLIGPRRIDGRWLVDGGLLNPVPVSLARALGADLVIAVELAVVDPDALPLAALAKRASGSEAEPNIAPELEKAESTREGGLFDNLADLSERVFGQFWPHEDSSEQARPSVYEVIGQSLQVMQSRITRSVLAGDPPELHVVPRLHDVGLMDFDRAKEAIEEGKRAVDVALAAQADFHKMSDRSRRR